MRGRQVPVLQGGLEDTGLEDTGVGVVGAVAGRQPTQTPCADTGGGGGGAFPDRPWRGHQALGRRPFLAGFATRGARMSLKM